MPTETLIKPLEVVTDGIFRPAPTTTNFDANLIAPFIASAEEGNTIRILGKDLYEAMIAAQNPNVSNYNPDAGALVQKFPTNAFYETLWTKYLLRYEGLICYATALPFIGLKTTSQGILINNTEYADNAGIQGVKFMQDTIQRHIDNLEPLINAYLCDNKADYPTFESSKLCADCCDDCNDSYCGCGYSLNYNKPCPTCKTGRNSSTKIIFY
jgi:hypothetical protein